MTDDELLRLASALVYASETGQEEDVRVYLAAIRLADIDPKMQAEAEQALAEYRAMFE